MEQVIRRGEMHYMQKNNHATGCEQSGARPVVVVSNDMCNEHSPIIEVVYMTNAAKRDLPTHVKLHTTSNGNGEGSTVLCESVYTISKERLSDDSYYGRVSDEDMEDIDAALLVSLDLDRYLKEEPEKQSDDPKQEIPAIVTAQGNIEVLPDKKLQDELTKANVEAEFYKQKYDELLERVMVKAKL